MGQMPRYDADGRFVGSMTFDPNCSHPRNQWKSDGTCSDGCCDDYICGACGKRIRLECPD